MSCVDSRQVFGGTPFATVSDSRIHNQELVLLTGDQLRTAYGLSPLAPTSLEALQASPKPIMTTAYDTGWEAIAGLTSEEIAFLRRQELPNLQIRQILESKVNFANAVNALAQTVYSSDGLLKQYLRDRNLPQKTIDGVAESFRSFFPTTTVLDPNKVNLLDTLKASYDASVQYSPQIVIKGEPKQGSYGGQQVHIYDLSRYADSTAFANQVLLDQNLSTVNTTNHFPLIVQNFEAGTSGSVQLAFPQHPNQQKVNLVDFALTKQVLTPQENYIGSVANFNSLDSLTRTPEEASHLLLSLEAVMHQILINHGYTGGLPEAIQEKALKTFGIDFIRTAQGGLKLIDLNPRRTGALPLLAQSYQKQLLGTQASVSLILGGLPPEQLGALVAEEGTKSASQKIGSFIQFQLAEIARQCNVEILPLGTTLATSVIKKLPNHNEEVNLPFAMLAQEIQILGNQSVEVCQQLFAKGLHLAEASPLTQFLTKR